MRKLEATDMRRMTVEEFRASEKMRLTVVLDNVRSMHNVGSVLRTADAFRVERVVMCGITCVPPNAELHKTALGAEDSVEWEYCGDTLEAVERLHGEGYTVCAIEQCEGSVMLDALGDMGERVAVVLGNEVHGVRQEVVDACDVVIEIPQFGTKHSLNVSVTAGIVIWEMARRMLLSGFGVWVCLMAVRRLLSFVVCMLFCLNAFSQELVDASPYDLDSLYTLQPTWYVKKERELYDGEMIPVIVLPEIPVYEPLVFKSRKQQQKYDRLVRNVKKVLPLAKMIRAMILETYEVLETLPPSEREAHMKMVEKEIKQRYTPVMKKLTFSQGKLLIKLVDRECNQSSYRIVQAFLGSSRAFFYQIFAWTLGASLKKTYKPEGEDAMVERVVRQVELGIL